MRQLLAAATLTVIVLAVSACEGDRPVKRVGVLPALSATPPTSPSAEDWPVTAPVVGSPAADVAVVTQQVCAQAAKVGTHGAKAFNEQFMKITEAAAKGDQVALKAAFDAVHTEFHRWVVVLGVLAAQDVTPALKQTLTGIITDLDAMLSTDYKGSPNDIKKKLNGFNAALAEVCG